MRNDLKCQFVCTNTSTHPWLDDGTSLLSLIRNLAGIRLPSAPSDISESSPLKEMLQRGKEEGKHGIGTCVIYGRRDSLPVAQTEPIQVGVEGHGGLEGGKEELE